MTNGTSSVNIGSALPFMGRGGADPGFSKWQLDPRDVMELMEHALRGEIWKTEKDDKGGKWVRPKGVDPMMNELGIQAVLQKVTVIVNRVVIMSNLDEEAINSWLWDLGHVLAAELVAKSWPDNLWELDFKNLDTIHDMIMLLAEVSLKRAMYDGERKKLYEAQSITETRVEDSTSRGGGGLLSWIPGMGGKKS